MPHDLRLEKNGIIYEKNEEKEDEEKKFCKSPVKLSRKRLQNLHIIKPQKMTSIRHSLSVDSNTDNSKDTEKVEDEKENEVLDLPNQVHNINILGLMNLDSNLNSKMNSEKSIHKYNMNKCVHASKNSSNTTLSTNFAHQSKGNSNNTLCSLNNLNTEIASIEEYTKASTLPRSPKVKFKEPGLSNIICSEKKRRHENITANKLFELINDESENEDAVPNQNESHSDEYDLIKCISNGDYSLKAALISPSKFKKKNSLLIRGK
jgi:hypothetical protein